MESMSQDFIYIIPYCLALMSLMLAGSDLTKNYRAARIVEGIFLTANIPLLVFAYFHKWDSQIIACWTRVQCLGFFYFYGQLSRLRTSS